MGNFFSRKSGQSESTHLLLDSDTAVRPAANDDVETGEGTALTPEQKQAIETQYWRKEQQLFFLAFSLVPGLAQGRNFYLMARTQTDVPEAFCNGAVNFGLYMLGCMELFETTLLRYIQDESGATQARLRKLCHEVMMAIRARDFSQAIKLLGKALYGTLPGLISGFVTSNLGAAAALLVAGNVVTVTGSPVLANIAMFIEIALMLDAITGVRKAFFGDLDVKALETRFNQVIALAGKPERTPEEQARINELLTYLRTIKLGDLEGQTPLTHYSRFVASTLLPRGLPKLPQKAVGRVYTNFKGNLASMVKDKTRCELAEMIVMLGILGFLGFGFYINVLGDYVTGATSDALEWLGDTGIFSLVSAAKTNTGAAFTACLLMLFILRSGLRGMSALSSSLVAIFILPFISERVDWSAVKLGLLNLMAAGLAAIALYSGLSLSKDGHRELDAGWANEVATWYGMRAYTGLLMQTIVVVPPVNMSGLMGLFAKLIHSRSMGNPLLGGKDHASYTPTEQALHVLKDSTVRSARLLTAEQRCAAAEAYTDSSVTGDLGSVESGGSGSAASSGLGSAASGGESTDETAVGLPPGDDAMSTASNPTDTARRQLPSSICVGFAFAHLRATEVGREAASESTGRSPGS